MLFDDLQGKSVLITGASGGLGLHFAELLASHGVAVTLAARRLHRAAINREFFDAAAGLDLIKHIPQRRLGQKLDAALMPLASVAGSYITGSSIEVDGGHLVSSL